jgi:sugar lactone lactonase YvrE
VDPNSLAFDQRGNLYVTESSSVAAGGYGQGGIWRIPSGGNAELWLRDDLLTGTGLPLGYPLGANGIAFYHSDLYVVNSDKGLVVRVPIMPNGDPGEPHVWAQLQEVYPSPAFPFIMGDGLALDVHGNVYVALVSRAAVVRIRAEDKVQETIAARFPNLDNAPLLPFDTPASLAFGTGKGGRKALFVTNLGWSFANPGLLKIEVDAPGLPLP